MQPRQPVSIENCDKEQIHIPGSVQSFGALIAFDQENIITRASFNIKDVSESGAEELLGQPLTDVIEKTELDKLDLNPSEHKRKSVHINLRSGTKVEAIQRTAGQESYIDLIISPVDRFDPLQAIQQLVSGLSTASSHQELAQAIADNIRKVSDFDRVKVYKFDADWNGEVIAEARKTSMPSYKGLHFPESDIPKQARELYIRNRVRVIGDVNDPQAMLVQGDTANPLDLSFSLIRSVSPIHLQYLRNMDVRSSMSISLFERGKFWGLVACHHETPRQFTLTEASFYQTVSDLCSNRISEIKLVSESVLKERALKLIQDITGKLNTTKNLNSLLESGSSLDELIAGTGVAAVLDGQIVKKNAVPDESTLRSLLSWLERGSDDVFVCDDLPSRFGDAIGSYACGLLAVRIPGHHNAWLMWFRFEITKEINWAGDPFEPKPTSPYGERLYPRTSFQIWQEKTTRSLSAVARMGNRCRKILESISRRLQVARDVRLKNFCL